MFNTETNDTNQGATQQAENFLDQSFELQDHYEYESISFDDFEETPAGKSGDTSSSVGDGSAGTGEAGTGENPKSVVKNAFDDLDTNPKQEAKTDDADEDTEALIAKLEAKGIKVQKPEESNEEVEFNKKLQEAETSIRMANEFINLPDRDIVFEKIKNDLANKYHQVGRGNEINSEDFKLELEAEMDQYDGNTAMTKIYADNIRNQVKTNSLSKAVQNKESLIKEK